MWNNRYVASAWLMAMLAAGPAGACPFCTVTSQTISEEMASMDAVVLARLSKLPEPETAHALSEDVPKAVFEVSEVLKGTLGANETKEVRTIIFGQEQVGDLFLIMGAGGPNYDWTTPLKVSERAMVYLRQLGGLPEKGPQRLAFFQNYLEDSEPLLSRDAYDEFAKAPYSELKDLRDKMNHDQLVSWLHNPETPLNRKRLYMVMLSACGGKDDLPMLEQLLRNEDRKVRAGLDAMLGCYLMLAGNDGMGLVEDLFLKNTKAEYADTYAAIMALRFLGTETQAIPRERILAGLHCLLDRPELADLVIPDLARWEDWSQVERLAKLFTEADKKSSWVRVPIINFLRACPQPEAKRHLDELAKLDPEAFKRAETFFPFGGSSASGSPATPATAATESPTAEAKSPPDQVASGAQADPAGPPSLEKAAVSAAKLPVLHRTVANDLNPWTCLLVFWLVGSVFFVAQWAILAGVGRRT